MEESLSTDVGCVSFRKVTKKRPISNRKREEKTEKPARTVDEDDPSGSGSEDESDDSNKSGNAPAKVKKTLFGSRSRRLRKNPLLQKSTPRGNPKRDVSDSNSSSTEADSDGSEAERQKALDVDFTIKSSNNEASEVPKDMGATKISEHDTAHDQDYQAQFERTQAEFKKVAEQGPSGSGEKIYRGLKMYGAKEAKDTVKGKASSGLNHYGPIRAQQFMRASVRWDYAPDICKDYKETGFCTFGDSCKFLHDRGDYKHGWEIEQEWQKQQQEKDKKEEDYTIHSDED